jgi:hypothetical protein
MNTLVLYYIFFVASAVWFAVRRDSPLVSQTRLLYVSNLLLPPLLLILQELNLEFLWMFVLMSILFAGLDRLLRTGELRHTTAATFRLWLVVWLIEGAMPLLLHFVLRSRQYLERVSLFTAGLALLAGTLVMFLVVAPDLPKHTGD